MRAPFADSIMLLSSVSVATAVEFFASVRVRYKLVAISMHSNAPDNIMSLALAVADAVSHLRPLPVEQASTYDDWGDRDIVGYCLKSVTLITAPRSPSLPPSLG